MLWLLACLDSAVFTGSADLGTLAPRIEAAGLLDARVDLDDDRVEVRYRAGDIGMFTRLVTEPVDFRIHWVDEEAWQEDVERMAEAPDGRRLFEQDGRRWLTEAEPFLVGPDLSGAHWSTGFLDRRCVDLDGAGTLPEERVGNRFVAALGDEVWTAPVLNEVVPVDDLCLLKPPSRLVGLSDEELGATLVLGPMEPLRLVGFSD